MNKLSKGRHRGAAVEVVFVALMAGLLLEGFVFFTRLGLSRHRALSAARLGSLLQSSQWVEIETARLEVQRSLTECDPRSSLRWEWTLGRYDDTPASRFYRLVETKITGQSNSFSGLSLPSLSFQENVVLQEADIQ